MKVVVECSGVGVCVIQLENSVILALKTWLCSFRVFFALFTKLFCARLDAISFQNLPFSEKKEEAISG